MRVYITAAAIAAALALGPVAAAWQGTGDRHQFTFGAGAAIPRRSYGWNNFRTSPVLGVSYEWRFSRHFGAETGLEAIFGHNRRYYKAHFAGENVIHAFLVPFGLRAHAEAGRLIFRACSAAHATNTLSKST